MGGALEATSQAARTYTLLGPDVRPYRGAAPGAFGGNKRGLLYGRLDCPAAPRAIARGGYLENRAFFADEVAAVRAGYRPGAACLPTEYVAWKTLALALRSHKGHRLVDTP